MDQVFFREQALRVRGLAEKADPFTRKRLLDLADKYGAKAGGPSRASRLIDSPLPLPKSNAAHSYSQSGEA